MNEILQGIQVIKMYTWEPPFADIVDKIRRKEINGIRGTLFVRGALLSFNLISRFALFLSLVTFVYFGNVFTARKVFIVTSYFNLLYSSMLHYWSLALTNVAESYITIKRIQEFLLYDEAKLDSAIKNTYNRSDDDDEHKILNEKLLTIKNDIDLSSMLITGNRRIVKKESKSHGVFLENASAVWATDGAEEKTKNSKPFQENFYVFFYIKSFFRVLVDLISVNLNVKEGQLCTIIGPVGSGKSTLLQVILGELDLDEGIIEINGTISYSSQEMWLFEGTIRDNIIFTGKYDEKRYKEIIKVCALERDLKLLPHGDHTIIGERGVSLSGGQRARVNLARAVYKKADIYLLDDPLSAVDTHVSKHLFEKCIKRFLKVRFDIKAQGSSFDMFNELNFSQDKVCVLVTHQLQYLKDMEHIVLFNNGYIEAQGTFAELKATKSFSMLTATILADNSDNELSDKRLDEVIDYIIF